MQTTPQQDMAPWVFGGEQSNGSPTVVILPKKLSREVFGSRPDDVSEIARSMLEWRGPLG